MRRSFIPPMSLTTLNTEVGIYKRKQELDQESDQENKKSTKKKKKKLSFFLDHFLGRVLVFLFS